MSDTDLMGNLREAIAAVRVRIAKYRSEKNFSEQSTKTALIVPVLQALGWDTSDPDTVSWEYRAKPKYNPVDFALLLHRTPCLLVEAKALRDPLRDDKLLNQIFSYASVAGVQWVVLTNGDEYRIYNAAVIVPAEDKLFRTIVISRDADNAVLSTLALLSQSNLQEKKIGRLWDAYFVDRQVKSALEDLLHPGDPKTSLISAIRKLTGDKLTVGEVRASLRRARIAIEFPEEPATSNVPAVSRGAKSTETKKSTRPPSERRKTPATNDVSLRDLIEGNLLAVPAVLECKFRGHSLNATVELDGSVTFQGKKYSSPSQAASVARRPFYVGGLPPERLPATNGWMFWKAQVGGKQVRLDDLRKQLLKGKSGRVVRFHEPA